MKCNYRERLLNESNVQHNQPEKYLQYICRYLTFSVLTLLNLTDKGKLYA